MQISDIQPKVVLLGIESDTKVVVQAVSQISPSSVQIFYVKPSGEVKMRLITEVDLPNISVASDVERPWSFKGNANEFKLALEAKRIELAYMFDPMMAVHSSNIEALPHQISAVYEHLLPRMPLRFVLADDPGAGKTVMAGLFIKELLMRADSRRILIVAPGSLVEQWRDELYEKFDLSFDVFSSSLASASPLGNPYAEKDRLIVRLDQFARNEEEQARLAESKWDLVIFDEAHKLSAHFGGKDVRRTQRFQLAERLGASTRHLLLMTATPHNGNEADFQLFMSLLDADRFAGKFREGIAPVDTSDLMRRMVKEELRRFDGTLLFPERKAYTVRYDLSEGELGLYEQVTAYVSEQMGLAEQRLKGDKKNSVGFALTSLQRRLASSPEAIYKSIDRRLDRMEKLYEELVHGVKPSTHSDILNGFNEDFDEDDLDGEQQENVEETIVDEATVSQTKEDLVNEINTLKALKVLAQQVVYSKQDSKWVQLSNIIQGATDDNTRNLLLDSSGKLRKLIIFTEYKDTLNYLKDRIDAMTGKPEMTVCISGSTKRYERRDIQARFRTDENVRILVATDAAGEGVNLQNAHLMINYDLPWNPNRLEQRFGRVHRIGQTEVCHLWSLVAYQTREGAVYDRLLQKLEVEDSALHGKVFKILGECFQDKSLKELMIDAIRYGDDPRVKARLQNDIDKSFDPEHLQSLLEKDALASEAMTDEHLYAIKEEMDRAEARKLQPYYVRDFFLAAMDYLSGSVSMVEPGRYKIRHVPASVIERYNELKLQGKGHVAANPVQSKYERVCFEKDRVNDLEKPDSPKAEFLHPGHSLMYSLTQTISSRLESLMQQGTIFLSENELYDTPYILYLLTHEIKDGLGETISKRFQFVRLNPDGSTSDAGFAPHLDLKPFPREEIQSITDVLNAPWVSNDFSQVAISAAVERIVPEHFESVSRKRRAYIDKVLKLVNERLTTEIRYQNDMLEKAEKKDDQLNMRNIRKRLEELTERLDARKKMLAKQRDVVNQSPLLLGAALVIPRQMLPSQAGTFAVDAAARLKLEKIGMDAVTQIEQKKGCRVIDVSKHESWDITSEPAKVDGRVLPNMLIEVKARINTKDVVTVTHNEYMTGLNKQQQYTLALVLVKPEDDSVDEVWYWKAPFSNELNPGVERLEISIDSIKKNGVRIQ